MFDRIFLDEIRVRGGGQNCLYAYDLKQNKDTDDLVDGKSLISTSGTELEKAGLATTAAPAPAHRSPHVARVRAPRVATPGHGVTTAVTAATCWGTCVML